MKTSTPAFVALVFSSAAALSRALVCEEEETKLETCVNANCDAAFLTQTAMATEYEDLMGDIDTSSLSTVCDSVGEFLSADICQDNECPECLDEQIAYAECSGPALGNLLSGISSALGDGETSGTTVASTEEGETCEIVLTGCSAGSRSFSNAAFLVFLAAVGATFLFN